MSWATIAATEVLEEFNPQEKTSINGMQGATTNLAGVLARVVGTWRGAISLNQPLGATDTIPADVRSDVIAEARWRWLVSMPSLSMLQTEEREGLYDDALDHLKEIRKGQLVEAADPEVPVSVHGMEVASANARKADAAKLDGLM